MPAQADLTERDGLKLIAPEAALVKVPDVCFVRNPVDVQVVLSGIPDASIKTSTSPPSREQASIRTWCRSRGSWPNVSNWLWSGPA